MSTPKAQIFAQLVHKALAKASQLATETALASGSQTTGALHAMRSSRWVHALAEELRQYAETCSPMHNVIAFCKSDKTNRSAFRTSELLFDILVAETKTIPSVNRNDIQALSKALWVVESELKQTDSRDVLIDLNKLVLAKSVNKVLVISSNTPIVAWAQNAMETLLDPSESSVYLVTIPHPEHWRMPPSQSCEVLQLTQERGWLKVELTQPNVCAAGIS